MVNQTGMVFAFNNDWVGDITEAVYRALQCSMRRTDKMKGIRKQIMQLDFSWDQQRAAVYTFVCGFVNMKTRRSKKAKLKSKNAVAILHFLAIS